MSVPMRPDVPDYEYRLEDGGMTQKSYFDQILLQAKRIVSHSNSSLVLAGTCFLLALSQAVVAGENATYQQHALRLIDQADDVFIRKGLCVDKRRDCSQKELIFFGLSASGIEIELYDQGSNFAYEVIGLCFAEYERNKRRMSISVTVYRQPHRDRVNKLFSIRTPKPYIEMNFKEEQ